MIPACSQSTEFKKKPQQTLLFFWILQDRNLLKLLVCSISYQPAPLIFKTKNISLTAAYPRSIIFTIMNVKIKRPENKIAEYLKVLGSPFRIQILLSIGYGEACVCHLEAMLKKRQAYISQHLMVLRDAGILDTRRDGKYIYYRVADKEIFDLIRSSAQILDIPEDSLPEIEGTTKLSLCECPTCQD